MRRFIILAFTLIILLNQPATAFSSQNMEILISPTLPICVQIGGLLRAQINSGYLAYSPLSTDGNPAHGEKDDVFIRGVYGDLLDIRMKQVDFLSFKTINQPRLQALIAEGKQMDTHFSVARGIVDLDGDGHREAVYQLLYLKPNATFGEVYLDNPNSALGMALAEMHANYVFQFAGRGYVAQRTPGSLTIIEIQGKDSDAPPPKGQASYKAVCQYRASSQ